MEIGLPQLFGLDEKSIINLNSDQTGTHNSQSIDNNWNINNPSIEQIECKHELEKANLIIEQQQKEIDYLKQQVNDLRDIINLMKKQEQT